MLNARFKKRFTFVGRAGAAVIVVVCGLSISAGEAAKPKDPPAAPLQPQIYRPFKTMPDVLFYESFSSQPSYTEQGKLVTEEPAPPGSHVMKFGDPADWGKNDKIMWIQIHLNHTAVSIPHGLDPAKIYVQAMVWPEETGELTLKFHFAKGDYQHSQSGLKVKTWNPVSVKLADVRNKNVKPEIDHLIDDFTLLFKPLKSRKDKDGLPKVYVSQLLITYGSKPEEVLSRVMAAEKKRTDAERRLDRDGFSFSLENHDLLKTALKPFKGTIKPKTVVVMGSSAEATPLWVKALATAAKGPGFTFKPALSPEQGSATPAGGLADMRQLLQANLTGDPQFAVLAISADDIAEAKSRAEDSVRVVAERTLAEGTIPVIVVASPRKVEEAKRFEDFNLSVSRTCAKLGVPMVSMDFQIPKLEKPEKDKSDLDFAKAPPESLEKTAAVVSAALKHVQESLTKD